MPHALAAWSSGIVSACGVIGREIESRRMVVIILKMPHRTLLIASFYVLIDS
jgi:hypothetical protein